MRNSLLLVLALFAQLAFGQALYTEGDHYTVLENPAQVADPSRIEVLEIFSYGCPHCYEFEEVLGPWSEALPDDVALVRMPAALGRQFFAQMAAAYHLGVQFGVIDEMHEALFEEIHVKQNRAIASLDGMAEFFGRYGVSREDFEAALQGETLQKAFDGSETAIRQYPLTGVPTVIVNGKYHVGRNQHVGSYQAMLDVVDYLLSIERAAM